jgi:two-component system response regulator PilR (NtrC family)
MPATDTAPLSVLSLSDPLCAPGSPLEKVLRLADGLAQRECPLFLGGESGTGKEVLAQYVHARSRRQAGPFVAVNCAAVTPGLVESELFGHKRGAFTGAFSDRPGRIRNAQGGTLFLDEIGDMPLELQARLLRVLQEKRVCPVGGDAEVAVDFRLLCATHRDLAAEVEAGRFRADLYYRMRVLELRLPPLRDRPGDIPFLLRAFLSESLESQDAEAAVADLPAEILRHAFPGNVRELRNLAERYAALHGLGGGWNEAFEGFASRSAKPRPTPEVRNSRLESGEILAALSSCGYHRGRAAEKLGVTRRALQYRLAGMRER